MATPMSSNGPMDPTAQQVSSITSQVCLPPRADPPESQYAKNSPVRLSPEALPKSSVVRPSQPFPPMGNDSGLPNPQCSKQPTRMIDDGGFSSINHDKPVVSLPPKPPGTTTAVLPMPNGRGTSNLESQMREMILRNEGADGSPGGSRKQSQQLKPAQTRPSRRANQAERRQRNIESQQLMANHGRNESPGPATSTRQQARTQQPYPRDYLNVRYPNTLPLSGQYSAAVAPHLRGQQTFGHTKADQWPSARPAPHHRQLFDPYANEHPGGLQSQNGYRGATGSRGHVADIRDQIDFIDFHARKEILRAEISPDESETKHALRLNLEEICRCTVADFERQKDPSFAVESVELKCFGSLSTNFATKGSDMDLVLLSPLSTPRASSTESVLPRLIEKALLDHGYGARLLTRTRVPIIKFCQAPDHGLARRLWEARSAWEKETDAGPLAEKKLPKKSKAKTRMETNGDDQADPTLPHYRPHAVEENVDVDRNSSGTHDPLAVLAGHTEQALQLPPMSESLSAGQASEVQAAAPAMDLEGNDPSLDSKTDEERAKLYTLAIKEQWYEPAERCIIFDFTKALEHGATETTLEQARARLRTLPNILRRYRPPPEKQLEFPRDGVGIQCDINFSNRLALHNSELLRCYSLCDSRVRPMVLFIKAWAKKRKINSAYEGTLSSYGYVLMVLHYLVNVASPAVLPNLQHHPAIQRDEISSKVVELDGYNIQFFRNEGIIRKLAASGQWTLNKEPLGSLIRGFFQYFGSHAGNSFQWMREVLSLRTPGGILAKDSKGWVAAKTQIVEAGPGSQETKDVRQRYLIAIEDPFEVDHNVGRTVSHNGIAAIRDEFRRAHRLIQAAGVGTGRQEDLFAEVEGRGNLQYRYFGARPKRDNVKNTKG